MRQVTTPPARPGRPVPRGAATLTALDGVVVTSAGVEAFDCPLCGDVRDLVVPTCEDEHDDCPDRACAECGFAVAVGHVAVGHVAVGHVAVGHRAGRPGDGVTVAGVRTLPGTGPTGGDDGSRRTAPAEFTAAVAALTATRTRPDVRLEPVRPPQRLAPWSHAVAADVVGAQAGDPAATGRLVLLHDPDGHEAWNGTLRLVAFVTAELDEAMSTDPLLPTVGWSWLTDALVERGAAATAEGGTVTHTLSSRFGDLAGPSSTASLELRASWTATDPDLGPHLLAFVDVLVAAAGLPPEGVTVLGRG